MRTINLFRNKSRTHCCQRKSTWKKRTLKGTGHLGDMTFKLKVRESRSFWRLPLSCRVTAASAFGHLYSPREATSWLALIPQHAPCNKLLYLVQKFHFRLIPRNYGEIIVFLKHFLVRNAGQNNCSIHFAKKSMPFLMEFSTKNHCRFWRNWSNVCQTRRRPRPRANKEPLVQVPDCTSRDDCHRELALFLPLNVAKSIILHFAKRVLKDIWWCICHLSSVVKSAALKKSCHPHISASIPAENTSIQIHMDLSK